GKMPIIGTMATGSFKSFMEQNPLKEFFEVIHLAEPDQNTELLMLLEKAEDIENKYHVSITYKAITLAASYADRYAQDVVLPGSGVMLLEDAANAASSRNERTHIVTPGDVVKKLEDKTHIA